MANQDTTDEVKTDENIKDGVETTKVEDETLEKDNQKDESDTGKEQSDDKTEDDESKDGDETKDETKAEFKKRFTQLKGETPEEYIKNLEDAYANSSTEGQRTAKEAKDATERFNKIASLVATDPDFAEKLATATDENAVNPVVDPATKWAREQMDKEYSKDYSAFAELHPEMISDENLRTEVITELDIIGQAYEARGKTLTMAEGLKKAWISLGYDEIDKKDDVVDKTKEQASTTSTQTTKKTDSDKPTFTKAQIAMAEKMGLTVEQLAEHNK